MNRDENLGADEVLTILLYASDRTTRQNIRLALGRKVAVDLPPVRLLEVATQAAVLTAMDAGGIDLAILGWRGGARWDGALSPTQGRGSALSADPAVDRASGRCVAGDLVAGRWRCIASG